MNIFGRYLPAKGELEDMRVDLEEIKAQVLALKEQADRNSAYRPVRFGTVNDLLHNGALPPNTLFVVQDSRENVDSFREELQAQGHPDFCCDGSYVLDLVAGFDDTVLNKP